MESASLLPALSARGRVGIAEDLAQDAMCSARTLAETGVRTPGAWWRDGQTQSDLLLRRRTLLERKH